MPSVRDQPPFSNSPRGNRMNHEKEDGLGLSPTQGASEPVRKMLAWLEAEWGASSEQIFAMVSDLTRKLRERENLTEYEFDEVAGPNWLAYLLKNAASCFQLLTEIRPAGVPLGEFERVVEILGLMRDRGVTLAEIRLAVGNADRIKKVELDLGQIEALVGELKRQGSANGRRDERSLLRKVASRILSNEDIDEQTQAKRLERVEAAAAADKATRTYEKLDEERAGLEETVAERKEELAELQRKVAAFRRQAMHLSRALGIPAGLTLPRLQDRRR